MSEWISVEDRLPPPMFNVLLYWSASKHIEDGAFYKDGNNLFHILFDGEALNEQPTHWMPIPEPPK